MNRRCFLQMAASLVVAPTSLVPVVQPVPATEVIDDALKVRLYRSNDGFGDHIVAKFIKGQYNTEVPMASGQDLVDIHGLCASSELAHIVIENLELHQHHIIELWNLGSVDFSDATMKAVADRRESLKRTRLTVEEKKNVAVVVAMVRGNHNCVHNGYRMTEKLGIPQWLIDGLRNRAGYTITFKKPLSALAVNNDRIRL